MPALVALVGATLMPVDGPVVDAGVLLLEGERIVAVGPADAVEIPADA